MSARRAGPVAASVAALVACGGSGGNNGTGDSGLPLDTVTCSGADVECNGTCVDEMTSTFECGSCSHICAQLGETCSEGHCIDSCAAILAANGSAQDGIYMLTDGGEIYCDMTGGGVTYREVDFGNSGSGSAYGSGYQMISLADFQDSKLSGAFIALFDAQGGAKLIAPWGAGSCCFRYDTSGNMLGFGSNYLQPMAPNGTLECHPTGGVYSSPEAFLLFDDVGSDTLAEAAPLDSDFFVQFPPRADDTCPATGDNPAFYWKIDRP